MYEYCLLCCASVFSEMKLKHIMAQYGGTPHLLPPSTLTNKAAHTSRIPMSVRHGVSFSRTISEVRAPNKTSTLLLVQSTPVDTLKSIRILSM